MKKLLKILLLTLLLTNCAELYEIDEAVYLIKAGEHDSQIENSLNPKGLRTLKSETMSLTVRFDETAIYNLGNRNQGDINKLFGFADCNSLHHENSARFGWNFNIETNQVDIYTYVYQSSNRLYEKIGSMEIGESADLSIRLDGDKYVFWFKDEQRTMTRGAQCNLGVYYLLYPYFGGNEKAPHDIRIYIKEHL